MHMDKGVGWVSDHTTDCMEGKDEILDYCKKMYPSLGITNIVESSEHKHIKGWCPLGKTCTTLEAFKVRPYRYLYILLDYHAALLSQRYFLCWARFSMVLPVIGRLKEVLQNHSQEGRFGKYGLHCSLLALFIHHNFIFKLLSSIEALCIRYKVPNVDSLWLILARSFSNLWDEVTWKVCLCLLCCS